MVKLLSTNGQVAYNVDEYAVDKVEELESLPKKAVMGSVAIVISTGQVFMKNGEGKWVEL